MVYRTKISVTATVATLFGLNTEEDAVKALILCTVKAQQDTFFQWAWDVIGQQYTEEEKLKVCDRMCLKSITGHKLTSMCMSPKISTCVTGTYVVSLTPFESQLRMIHL